MSKIVKNNTGSTVEIRDTGVSISGLGQYTIPENDYHIWAASNDTVSGIGSSVITINDGSFDLSMSNGVDLIKGIFPNPVGISGKVSSTSGVPMAAGEVGQIFMTPYRAAHANLVNVSGVEFGTLTNPMNVSVTGSTLPTGAATALNQTSGMDLLNAIYNKENLLALESSQVSGNNSLASIDSKLNSLGQKTMANSVPVVLASDQNLILTTSVSGSNIGVYYQDSANLDAFGRLRVSEPRSIFDTAFRYDKQPLVFSESVSGSATVTHSTTTVSVSLNVTTNSSDEAKFQSRRRFPYHPGKSQLILITGNLEGGVTNNQKGIGLLSDNNGYFFQMNGTTPQVGTRSSVTGSIVDSLVSQTSWNIDKMDGTGISGINIDFSKQQIFVIDFQWLGSGRVRFGFSVNGIIHYCHYVNHSNSITTPYSQTALLPIRAFVKNTDTLSAPTSLKITCCCVISEGGFTQEGILRAVDMGITTKSVSSTANPILAIRKSATYISSLVDMLEMTLFSRSDSDLFYQVVLNPTITGGAWVAVDGVCEINKTGTAVSGGYKLLSGYFRAAGGTDSTKSRVILDYAINQYLGSDLNNVSDIMCIIVQTFTTSANVVAGFTYKEYL